MGLGAFPAGAGIAAAEGGGVVPAALGLLHAGRGAVVAGVRLWLDVGDGQFIDEAAGQLRGPAAIDHAVGGEADARVLLGAGDADVGQAAFLLQSLQALFVDAALAGEDAFLPASAASTKRA